MSRGSGGRSEIAVSDDQIISINQKGREGRIAVT